MKKNIFKTLALIFCMALCLTGCATVSNVFDKNGNKIYFDELAYFEGQVALVGDYIYYGNSYADSSEEGFSYNSAKKTGYMSRLDVSGKLGYDYTEDEDGYINPSPANVEKVNGKLTGYQNQNMYALGEYLYFTSANTHRDSDMNYDYTQVSLFRMNFNGDNVKEIETFRYDENSIITMQKGSDGNYYYIAYTPTAEETYNLYSIKVGSSIGKVKTLAENVLSCAICDETSTIKNVIYTVNSERSDYETISVKSVDFATGEVTDYGNDTNVAGSTTTILGRSGDIVFYNYSDKLGNAIYYKDLVNDDKYFTATQSKWFYDAEKITLIGNAWEGYVFISSSSSSVMYKTLNQSIENIESAYLTSEDYEDILFVDGDYIYYSNSTSISRINVRDRKIDTLVTMTSIISGQCGYANGYVYFYAQLESSESETDTENTDTNYYLHRVDSDGNTQLMSKVEKP